MQAARRPDLPPVVRAAPVGGAAWGIALAVVAGHGLVNALSPYSVHRDELLYLAMGEHLRLWRMDFPPFIAVAANVSRWFGDSLVALRLFPALTHGALVLLAAWIAGALGGGRVARGLAALLVAANLVFLRPGNLFQPVVFDQLAWSLMLACLVRRIGTGDARWWLAVGAAAGFGLLVKFSVVFIGAAVAVAVLLTPLRRDLATPWPWAALGIAAVLGAPSLAGQVTLGYPAFTQLGELRESQLAHVGALDFVVSQFRFSPAVLVAAIGAGSLIAGRLRAYRAVGVACVAAFGLLLALRGKAYYIAPIYPALFAAGAVSLEGIAPARARRVAQVTAGAVAVLYAALLLPVGLPILPPPVMARYAAALGITAVTQTNRGEVLELPQDYADMLGWEEKVEAVARVYHALPPDERAQAVIAAENYGQAGAIDYFGRRLGLPKAIAATGSYWFWGPGDLPGTVLIKVGGRAEDLRQFYGAVEEVARVNVPWVVPEERNVPLFVARAPRTTLQALWPRFAGQN